MAEANVSPDQERKHLCLQATWEIDKIARMLPGLVPLDEDQAHYAVKALAGRMLRLSNALMSGLGDGLVSNDEIRSLVNFDGCNSQG